MQPFKEYVDEMVFGSRDYTEGGDMRFSLEGDIGLRPGYGLLAQSEGNALDDDDGVRISYIEELEGGGFEIGLEDTRDPVPSVDEAKSMLREQLGMGVIETGVSGDLYTANESVPKEGVDLPNGWEVYERWHDGQYRGLEFHKEG